MVFICLILVHVKYQKVLCNKFAVYLFSAHQACTTQFQIVYLQIYLKGEGTLHALYEMFDLSWIMLARAMTSRDTAGHVHTLASTARIETLSCFDNDSAGNLTLNKYIFNTPLKSA